MKGPADCLAKVKLAQGHEGVSELLTIVRDETDRRPLMMLAEAASYAENLRASIRNVFQMENNDDDDCIVTRQSTRHRTRDAFDRWSDAQHLQGSSGRQMPMVERVSWRQTNATAAIRSRTPWGCTKKSDGTEVCVSADQLAASLAGAGAAGTQLIAESAGPAATPAPLENSASGTSTTTPANDNQPPVIEVMEIIRQSFRSV
jgi:hypothetical protein